jgi:hypothetical protein
MNKLGAALGVVAASALAAAPIALAEKPPAKTFVVVLNAAEEVPPCEFATNASRGVAVLHVRDEASGTVEFKIVANNMPGDLLAAHIHIGPRGVAGPVVQALPPTPGAENGVIATGTFSNPALVTAIRANPENYYINVHTGPAGTGCPAGVIRGQLDDHGPANQ